MITEHSFASIKSTSGPMRTNLLWTQKIYFAIFYLKGIALDYFEPYINEPNLL